MVSGCFWVSQSSASRFAAGLLVDQLTKAGLALRGALRKHHPK